MAIRALELPAKPEPRARATGRACPACQRDQDFLRELVRPAYEHLTPRVRVVDLFCGCGGLSLGLAEAARRMGIGLRVPLALDEDAGAVRVYKKNFPNANVIQARVESKFDGDLEGRLTSNERSLRRQIRLVDVLVGGPPCQGHSDLNNYTRRDDDRNELYARMARAARVLEPAVVLIENVPTVKHDLNGVLDSTFGILEDLGYTVDERVVDLSILGVPQRRKRHLLIGLMDAEIDPSDILESLTAPCELHPIRTVKWAIGDLLNVKPDGIYDSASKPSPDNVRRIAYLFRKEVFDLPDSRRPTCHQSDHSYKSMYGRLRWNQPAQTVTTGFGSPGQGRYIHPGRQRTITPHEACRLQMLPDFFDLSECGTRGAMSRMIGNLVPPSLGIAVGQLVLSDLFPQPRPRSAKTGSGGRL